MEAAEAKVQKVLEGTKQFLVPHYQRPYSWREREWGELWRDVVELTETDDARPHFLGSIVTAPGRAVPEGVEKRLLIDGQQRLTTLVIVLALIRQAAAARDQQRLANKVGDLLTNRNEEGSDFYKMLPTQGESAAASDRDALLAIVDGRAPSTASGVVEASRYFAAKLARPDAPDLEKLYATLTGRLTLVSIILDKNDNPHRIFESLNGKGRPLSQVDLIRNYFFMRLPEADHERVYRTA